MRAFANQSTGAVPVHRDPTSPAHGCAGTLFRTSPVLPRRNGEPVSALTQKPALFAFRLYGSNLTTADNAIGKVSNERRNFKDFRRPDQLQ